MSAPAHAARMPPVAIAAVLRIGRCGFTLLRRPPRRVAALLVRLMARLLGARAAWGRTAALAMLAAAAVPATRGAHAAPPSPPLPPLPALSATALPSGATLAAGQATVAQSGNRMDIVQQTGKAILNWDTFNIGSGAAVTFRQPGADAVILNRVASNAPSQLLGSLSANGKVWLVNPAGIMVGQGATLDLHGFVASTLAVRDTDFLAGRMLFNATAQGAQAGAVRNEGTISTSSGGTVYLVAADVQNHGVIRAPGGEVVLAAGASVELLDTATPGVRVAVSGAEGSALNLGQVVSTAGRIGMAGVLVKNSGVLNASSVVSEGGRIFLRATQAAVADGAAQMLATGSRGGQVEITAGEVAVQGNALLDASGANGGGTVLVGGDYQGGGSLPRAQTASLGADAVLRADALANGNGGKVVLWSDQATVARGAISARGGAQGGDGGLVETSGLRRLSITGLRTDTTAARGKTGTLLLDPANIVIGAVADADGAGKGIDAGALKVDPAAGVATLDAGTYTGDTSKLTADAIATLLATTSVSLAATMDISIDTRIEKTAGGDQSLTLSAGRDIWLRQPVISTSGALALNLAAGGMIQSDTFGSQSLNGGLLTANAGGNLSLGHVVAGAVAATSTGGAVAINAPAALTLSGSAGTQYVVTAGADVALTSLSAGGGIAVNADGHQITFKGGTLQSAGNQSYQGAMVVRGGTTVTSGGTVDFNGTLNGTAGLLPALAIVNTGLATLANGSAGMGTLSVSGPALLKGNVATTGAQTYTGQLRIVAPVMLRGSRVTLNGGGVGNGGALPAPLAILAQNTSLSGTFEGFQQVSTGGTLAVTSLAMPSQWLHNGALNLADNGALTASGGVTLTGQVTLGADSVLTLAGAADGAFSGGIGGAGAIVKSGAGTTTFNSANTYSGATTVNGGTLKVAAANALGSGNLAIGAGGTVSLGADATIGGKLTSAGALSGTGTLSASGGYQLDGGTIGANLGSGTLTQASGSTQLAGAHGGGAVTIAGGALTFGAANRLHSAAAVTVDAAGTLDTSGFAQTVDTITSAGTVSAATGTLTATSGYTLTGGTLSGQFAGGGMAQTGGAVTLSGAYSGNALRVLGGDMTIGGGGLQAGAALLQTASGATLAINGATSTVNLLNNGVVDLSATLNVAGGVSENAGVININGAGGQFAMAAGTAFTNVAAGTVTLAGAHATPTSGGGTFDNAGKFNKTSAGAQSAVLTSNTGTLTATAGSLTLSGLAANAGAMAIGSGATVGVAGGTLTNNAGGVLAGSGTVDVGTGALVNNGKVSPGAGEAGIGTLSVRGDYIQGAGGTLAMDLGGHGAGQSDLLAVSGKAALDGALAAALAPAYKPVAFQPIALVTAGGARSGAFGKAELPAGFQPGYGLATGEAVRVNLVAEANYFSNGAGTLDWDNRDNWSKGKTPGNADDVVIDTGLGLAAAGAGKQAISNLRITPGAALDIHAGQFDIKRGAIIDGALRISGDGTAVTTDTLAGIGALTLNSGTLALTDKAPAIGALTVAGGALTISKAALALDSYTQGGGEVKGDAASSITVANAFSQAGGAISGIGTLGITQAAGTLTLGNISADTVNAGATMGGIAQNSGTALALRLLQVGAAGDVSLPQANTIAGVQGNAGGALSVRGVAAVDGALAAAGDITLAGSGLAIHAGVTSTGGNVMLQADEVDVYGGSTVASAGGAANFVKVHALSAAQPMKLSSLGGEDTGAGLLLNARDMAAFATPTLVLGDAGNTGAISLADGGDIAAPHVSGTLRFANGGAFGRSGAETITANGLDITAVGGILLGGANHVKSFTAANSGSGDIVFTNNSGAASLALGALANPAGAITVDNTGGIAASGPGAISAQGKVTLTARSPVVINTAISSGTGIALTASTGISLGAAARLANTARGAIVLLAQNGSVVLDAAARIDSGGGSTSLEARGAGGTVVAPPGTVTGSLVIASTELDNIAAAQAAAEAAEKAAAEAAAKAAADKAAAEAAAKAAADKAAAEAAAKAAADKAAAEAAAKAAADKAAADKAAAAAAAKAAADKEAADKAAAEAAAKAAADKAAADKAAAEAATKAAADKAAADKAAVEAAAKAAADKEAADRAAAEAAAKAAAKAAADKEAADKAAAEAAAKAAADKEAVDKAAAEAAAKAAADKAAAEAAAQAAAKAAAEQAATEAAAKAAAEQAAAEAAAKAATDAAAKAAAEAAVKAAEEAAVKAAAEAAAQAAAKAATSQSKPQPPVQDNKPQDSKTQDSKGQGSKLNDPASPANAADGGQSGNSGADGSSSSSPAVPSSSPVSAALAQAFEQQTIGGGADSFGGAEGAPGGDQKDGKDGKDGKAKEDSQGAAGDGKDKKAAKKMAVCR